MRDVLKMKKVIYYVCRDHYERDNEFNFKMVEYIKKSTIPIVWEDKKIEFEYKKDKLHKVFYHFPKFLRNFIRSIFKKCYKLRYYRMRRELKSGTKMDVIQRIECMRRDIERLSLEYRVYVMARSAGARWVSSIADTLKIEHIIAIGYPFKHPEEEEEVERYSHLKGLETPMTIIQGEHDEYGGKESLDKYPLSGKITLDFVQGEHDFKLEAHEWKGVFNKLSEILKGER